MDGINSSHSSQPVRLNFLNPIDGPINRRRRVSRLKLAAALFALGVGAVSAGERPWNNWRFWPGSRTATKVVGRPDSSQHPSSAERRDSELALARYREVQRLNAEVKLIDAEFTPVNLSLDEPSQLPPPMTDTSSGAASHKPWWQQELETPSRRGATTLPVSLESLLVRALEHSAQIKVYSELPLIRETAICEAEASFDPAAFLETRWDDSNDPVGNTLTTGGAPRYKNNQFSGAAGLRQRTRIGGKLEVSQRIGWQDTNSNFFVPDQQGTAKLALSYTQPLMRGRGTEYNESLIVLAQIDTDVSEDEFSRQLQSHLLEVARSYWGLYLERATFVQKRRSLARAEAVLKQLSARAEIDAVASQIQRAEAEVATRQSEFIRAGMGVQNAEDRIRALVNDPLLGDDEFVELVPTDLPTDVEQVAAMEESMATAIQLRPEVAQAINQIRAGCVRLEMSKNELMPVLNLVTETYMSELQNSGSIGDAFTDQFHEGGPGYSVGLQFEVPLGNRAARSRNDRRMMELRQLRNQYETTLKTLNLEVQVAVREIKTSFAEMQAHRRSMQASHAQLDYLEQRWKLLPGDGTNAPLMLDNLLTAQERLVRAESAYVQAWVTYNLSLINHRRATGELLQQQNISWSDYVDECDQVKTRILHKPSSQSEYIVEPLTVDENQYEPDAASVKQLGAVIEESTDEDSLEGDEDVAGIDPIPEEGSAESVPPTRQSRWKALWKNPFKRSK